MSVCYILLGAAYACSSGLTIAMMRSRILSHRRWLRLYSEAAHLLVGCAALATGLAYSLHS